MNNSNVRAWKPTWEDLKKKTWISRYAKIQTIVAKHKSFSLRKAYNAGDRKYRDRIKSSKTD